MRRKQPNGLHTEGDIYSADLDPTWGHERSGHRPVLILSRSGFNARSGTVIAVALTSQESRATVPVTLEIVGRGLPKRSWVKISRIRTLSVQRLEGRLGEATEEEVATVLEGLSEILTE